MVLCCDSAGIYYTVRSLLKSSSTSHFTLVGGCMAHQSNLFLKDLIKSSEEVGSSIQNATAIAKTVCKSAALNHSILQVMKTELKINTKSFALWVPTLTRWYSNGVSLKQVICIQNYLKMTFIKESEKDYFRRSKNIQNIQNIISNDSNWDPMKATEMILSPFNYITGLSEMDSATSGMVFGA